MGRLPTSGLTLGWVPDPCLRYWEVSWTERRTGDSHAVGSSEMEFGGQKDILILLSLPRRFALLLLRLASMRIPGAGPAQVRGGSGLFCFRSCYDLVRTHHDRAEEVDFIWGKEIARKMQLCAYRLLRGRLMTRDRLLRFGMQIPDAKCVLCNGEDESLGISSLYAR
ncbi:uncharacterized protein M6B38_310015 [Iris pallida]|uniref:Reverse transcriptase zinc-binding domain-containing protein n=1 Tax=Iris pallida TaxID=29817 RepID=A0AAX6HHL4_IRIPA|nr:uncharacterized protein M6B38_310010 [Iris pallida]KAJ6840519.1 uncharacterized protein M6B38_310015 [Iris pallida]